MPDPLWQVVGALLQPDPYARFRTATGARKALAAATELMPEPAPGEEPVEVFDQIGPLPEGFGPDGPLSAAPRAADPPAGPAPERREPLAQPPRARHAGAPVDPAPRPEPRPDPYPAAQPPAPPPAAGEQPLTHTRTRINAPAPAMPLPQPVPAPLPTPAPAPSAETASARLPARRPAAGPPARVVVPILVLALICFAVGFVALAAS